MADRTKIEALRLRLIDERSRVVDAAAESGALPPAKLLAYLADLDAAVIATEAVLEERSGLQALAEIAEAQ